MIKARTLIVFASLVAAAALRGEVRFEQRLGATLPLAAEFVDTEGTQHPLRDFFHGRPVVLYFGYARCPQLCPVVADGAVAALRQIRAEVGRNLEVVAISLDPEETPAESRARQADAVHRYGHPASASGWHFLRGDEPAIRAVADAAGFHYDYDPRSRQYAHPSGFVVVRPDGAIARYFLGVDFPARDVAQAIDDAAHNRSGRPVLDLLLLCFRGENAGGRYTALIARVLALTVVFTVLALGGGVAWMLRRERKGAS